MKRSPFLLLSVLLATALLPGCARVRTAWLSAVAVPVWNARAEAVYADPQGRAYFPRGSPNHSRELRHMREPSLLAELPAGSTFALRLTLLPALDGYDNLTVRAWDENGTVRVRAVRQRKKPVTDIYEYLTTVEDRTTDAGAALPEAIRELVSRKGFWKPLSREERDGIIGMDGVTWVLEWRDRARYHLLEMWSPDAGETLTEREIRGHGIDPALYRSPRPYADLGRLLLKLADVKTEAVSEPHPP